jgi:hypothetical protein
MAKARNFKTGGRRKIVEIFVQNPNGRKFGEKNGGGVRQLV